MRLRPLLFCPFVLVPFSAPAAGTLLDEIVVVATRRPEAVRDVAASVSSVRREDFEVRATRFIGEELRGLPGIVIGTNDAGTYTKLTVRGVPNRIHNDTLAVLVDGVPFLTGDDEADLEQLPFGAVGRVDLVRGPMSALYGRGAIAGTISYATREVGRQRLAEATVGAGSHGWRRAGVSLQTPTSERGALLLSGEAQRADGWRDGTGRREDSLFAKHRLELGDWGVLNVTGTWVGTDQNLAGELPATRRGEPVPLPGGRRGNWNNDDAGFAKRMLTATAILDARPSESLSTTTRLHARRARTTAIQGFFAPFDPASDVVTFTGFRVDNDTDTLFAEQTADWRSGPVRLLAGASVERVASAPLETWTGEFDFGDLFYAQRRDVRSGRFVNRDQWRRDTLLDADALSLNHAAYLQGDVDIGAFGLSAGARFDRFSRRVHYGPSGSGFGPDPVETIADSDQRVSPKASLTWRLGDALTAYAAYGAGFSPGFGPVWSFRGRDTRLAPELADNVEAGVKGDALDGRLSASLTIYELRRRDLLQLLPVEGTARTINTGRQRSRGVELETTLRPRDGLTLLAAYGLTDSVWLENRFVEPFTGRPFDFGGKDVAGVPRHAGRLEAIGATDRFEVRAWVDLSGDYAYDNANSVRAGGHAVWNAALAWRPTEAVEFTATVRNLFDRNINLVVANNDGPFAYFPQPPRELVLGATVRF